MDYKAILTSLMAEPSTFNKGFWVLVNEAQILVDQVEKSGAKVYIECGTCHGYSSCWVSTTQVEEIHTYDPVIRKKVWDVHTALKPLSSKINFHNQRFDEGLPAYLNTITRETKLYCFIDGKHSFNSVSGDFNAVLPFLKPEDRVMFHDSILYSPVARLMAQIRDKFTSWNQETYKTPRGMTEFIVR